MDDIMERTIKKEFKTADLLLTGDWHLRDDTPVCRTDNFESKQWQKVDFISDLQKKHNCSIIHAGDLFNHWKPSPYLLSMTMQHLPDMFYTIYGNHDLPQHNLDLANKCGIYVLEQAGKLIVLSGTHWGKKPEKGIDLYYTPIDHFRDQILVWHIMCYQGKLPWPDCPDPLSAAILRKYKDFNLIVTGHNHKSFVEEYQGRILVNPGSITRQETGQADFKPCVYLWYAETNTVEKVYLPIEADVISREHIEVKEQRDGRIDAFVERLNSEFGTSLSFEENLEQFFAMNSIRESVKNIIYKTLE